MRLLSEKWRFCEFMPFFLLARRKYLYITVSFLTSGQLMSEKLMDEKIMIFQQ